MVQCIFYNNNISRYFWDMWR